FIISNRFLIETKGVDLDNVAIEDSTAPKEHDVMLGDHTQAVNTSGSTEGNHRLSEKEESNDS
ncbi:hypothetical protein GCK32_015554, partial [Trichostrongylus colubriformis]